jgi:WD40 repeat protein
VNAVAVAVLDGRSVVISGSDDATVRLWDLAKGQPVRHIRRAVRLRHSAPVLTAVVQRRRDVVHVSTGCRDGTRWTWDLSTGRAVSRSLASHVAPVNSTALLAEDGVAFATGSTLIIDRPSQSSSVVQEIELESEVLALATDCRSTVVAGSRLGLVVLDVSWPR